MRTILQDVDNRIVGLIILASLTIRFCLLPFSETVHADAVTRTFLAADWLANPHYMTHGYWGPLQLYLNALSLAVSQGAVIGPIVLNICLASLSVVPIYLFTLRLFDQRRGAVFASLLFIFCPVVMRNSFMALAEVMFAFFILCSMYFLAESIKEQGKLRFAAYAGISMTLAAATRYEAWVILAAFTLVAFLHKEWKVTFVFWVFAMLFPASWMIGNHLEYGDFLYSIHQNDVWNLQMEGLNDAVDPVKLMERLIFFPHAFIINLTPLVFLLSVAGLVWAVWKRRLERTQLIWLLPFLIMVVVFVQKAHEGTFMLQQRFVITWVLLFLPFTALIFVHSNYRKFKLILMSAIVALQIPFSFCWGLMRPIKLFGTSNFGLAIENVTLNEATEMEAIPRLRHPETLNLIRAINKDLTPSDGLIFDSFGWKRTYYAALMSGTRGYISNCSKHGKMDLQKLKDHISEHPNGLIVLSRFGRLVEAASTTGSTIYWHEAGMTLSLTELLDIKEEKLFRYSLISKSDIPPSDRVDMFEPLNESELLELTIRNDKLWMNKIRRNAFWAGVPLDTEVKKTVIYTLGLENKSQ